MYDICGTRSDGKVVNCPYGSPAVKVFLMMHFIVHPFALYLFLSKRFFFSETLFCI